MRDFLRTRAYPPACNFGSCAVVGSSGTLIGARLGPQIDAHDVVIRINNAPNGNDVNLSAFDADAARRTRKAWRLDIGLRTDWRVMNIDAYRTLPWYPRKWLGRPRGRGVHADMSSAPLLPRIAFYCHNLLKVGMCVGWSLRIVLGSNASAYMLNPLLLGRYHKAYFSRAVVRQTVLTTGMAAIAFARTLCNETHIYGFGDGHSCPQTCYNYYSPCDNTSGLRDQAQPTQAEVFTTDLRKRHNFSAQARAIHQLVHDGNIVPHWGVCDHGRRVTRGGKP